MRIVLETLTERRHEDIDQLASTLARGAVERALHGAIRVLRGSSGHASTRYDYLAARRGWSRHACGSVRSSCRDCGMGGHRGFELRRG